jgi:hypothetical protein
MQTPEVHPVAASPLVLSRPRRSRGLVLLGAGTLALVLAATGIATALAGRSSPATQKHESSIAANSKEVAAAAQPSSSLRPVAPVLADGIYPTYIDQVDVRGAKMTLDLVQVFYDDAAATAAIEDGHSDADAVMGWYVYIRNQNSKLRTLPVARDLNIQFVDGCETPPGRKAALTELAKQTTPFNDLYFYEVTVKDGAIHRITQKLARAAC